MLRKSLVLSLFVAALYATPASAEKWEFHFTPYLWTAGQSGTVQVGPVGGDVDASFSDVVEFVDAGIAGHFEARNPRWGLFGDVFYVKLSDSANLPAGTISGEIKNRILEGGASWRFAEGVDALIGLRNQQFKTSVTLPAPIGGFSNDVDWTDGFVGLRWIPVSTGKWSFWVRGDIGAGDSDLVWLASVGGAYHINKTVALAAGYRYLDTDYEKNGVKWDVAMHGLLLGVDIAW
jgi:opacity protein-like surface antigen